VSGHLQASHALSLYKTTLAAKQETEWALNLSKGYEEQENFLALL
jgi:hypothetical protein